MILAVTGHRPDRILAGGRNAYDPRVARALVDFALACLEEHAPELVIAGMAQGWDQATAQACVECGIPFVAAVPFKGQDSKWPEKARKTYHWLLGQAAQVEVVAQRPTNRSEAIAALDLRNKWIIDRGELILALYDGSGGGTANAVRYAEQQGKPVTNVWAGWQAFTTTGVGR